MAASRSLPDRPSLASLRKQAKKIARQRSVSLRDAQLILAREYGYVGWRNLLAEVSKRAGNDLEYALVRQLGKKRLPDARGVRKHSPPHFGEHAHLMPRGNLCDVGGHVVVQHGHVRRLLCRVTQPRKRRHRPRGKPSGRRIAETNKPWSQRVPPRRQLNDIAAAVEGSENPMGRWRREVDCGREFGDAGLAPE